MIPCDETEFYSPEETKLIPHEETPQTNFSPKNVKKIVLKNCSKKCNQKRNKLTSKKFSLPHTLWLIENYHWTSHMVTAPSALSISPQPKAVRCIKKTLFSFHVHSIDTITETAPVWPSRACQILEKLNLEKTVVVKW